MPPTSTLTELYTAAGEQLPARPSTADRGLLRELREHTRSGVFHQCGTQAPDWLLEGLAHLTPGQLRRVHVWSGIHRIDARHRLTAYVRLHEQQLTVWRFRITDAVREPIAGRTDVSFTSFQEAVDVLVALQILHPQWSSVARRLTAYDDRGVDTCMACDTVADACPYHRGIEQGLELTVDALQVLVECSDLVAGDFGRLLQSHLGNEGVDGPQVVRLMRAIAVEPDLVAELAAIAPRRRAGADGLPC